MTTPVFLKLMEVLKIQEEEINRYGGDSGIRDLTLLESAVGMPQSGAFGDYFHPTLFEMAAAYLYHIVNNHPFIDANKRTGLAAAYVFLRRNGHVIECDPDVLADMVLAVVAGTLDKDGIARFFREYSAPLADAPASEE